jgi:tetratricopeptide (TPR) repeat protein
MKRSLIWSGVEYGLLTGAIAMTVTVPAVALSLAEVEAIAAEVTVLIDGLNPGSGVIIGRDRSRYLVLTARHVVATEDEYWIITPDGREYPLDYQTVRLFPDVDLAVLEFRSDRAYSVATLANYADDGSFPPVFVSGWTGSVIRDVALEHRFAPGSLLRKSYALTQAQDPLSRGYELFYTSITDVGMSGGPVLDTDGRVIGIHGRSEGEEIYQADTGEYTRLLLGFSAGISIQSFLQLAPQMGLQPQWQVERQRPAPLNPAELQAIQSSLEPPPLEEPQNPVAWVNRGNHFYRLERFEEALAAFDRAVRLQPDFHQAWYGIGQVLTVQGNYPLALRAYERVLQIQPDFYTVLRDRALVHVLLGHPRAAVEDFDRAVQQAPEDYIAWYLRGNLFRRHLGWYDAALGSYDRALELAPNFSEAWIARGRTLYALNRYPQAADSLQRAVRLDPDTDDGWYWLGLTNLALGQITDTLDAVDQAIALSNRNPDYWWLRGRALAELGIIPEARSALYQALERDRNHARARELLETLGE